MSKTKKPYNVKKYFPIYTFFLFVLYLSYKEGIFVWLTWLVLINVCMCYTMRQDKRRAKHKSWRVPGDWLITQAYIGGFIGFVVGQVLYNHKTNEKENYGLFKQLGPALSTGIILTIFMFLMYYFF